MQFNGFGEAELRTIYNAAKQSIANGGNWFAAYRAVLDVLTDTELVEIQGQPVTLEFRRPGVDDAVYTWVQGALKVNSNDGAFAGYIREYTARQHQLRTGAADPIDAAIIQDASNLIARNFVGHILYGAREVDGRFDNYPDSNFFGGSFEDERIRILESGGTLPTLNQVGRYDAGAAAASVFNGAAVSTSPPDDNNHSPWAGTVLFTNLGDGSFFREWILTLDTSEFKREKGAYDLFTAAQATVELKTAGFALNALANDLSALVSTLSLENGQLDTNDAATDQFFEEVYGVPVTSGKYTDLGSLIFGTLTGFFADRDIVHSGSIIDDKGDKRLTLDPATEFTHAGLGDDEITVTGVSQGSGASLRPYLIDGGEGEDELTFSGNNVTLEFDSVGHWNWRALAGFSDNIRSFFGFAPSKAATGFKIQHIYNVEKFILTNNGDRLRLEDASLEGLPDEVDLEIDASAGFDYLDVSAITSEVEIDLREPLSRATFL